MRTISEPARASAATWAMVPSISAVSVVGHRLHDDRRTAANGDVSDLDLGGPVPGRGARDV
ncbi:hypothetical protein ACVJDU_001611 [Bradyrhizobium diazoefficiens]